jgi:hypothetical protein
MLQRHDDAATYWQRGGSRLRTKMQVISNCNRGTYISVTSAVTCSVRTVIICQVIFDAASATFVK